MTYVLSFLEGIITFISPCCDQVTVKREEKLYNSIRF